MKIVVFYKKKLYTVYLAAIFSDIRLSDTNCNCFKKWLAKKERCDSQYTYKLRMIGRKILQILQFFNDFFKKTVYNKHNTLKNIYYGNFLGEIVHYEMTKKKYFKIITNFLIRI